MPERSTMLQTTQIGVEALGASGVSVAANRRLASLSIEPSIDPTIDRFRPAGQKFDAITQLNREQTSAPITGRVTYSEIVYPLASALTNPVITGSAGTGYTWTFSPVSKAEDTPRTFTVEVGGPVRAHKFTYGLITEITMDISRNGVELGGTMLGRALVDGITMTATPTELELIPVQGKDWSVYLDPTSGALGTTKLGRVLSATWGWGGRFNPLYILDRANPDFVAHVEVPGDATYNLLVEADAAGMALLTAMRGSETRFVRLEAEGPAITGAGGALHSIDIDMAGRIDDVADFSDEDGVYAVGFQFRLVHDPTWNRALQVVVTNGVASL